MKKDKARYMIVYGLYPVRSKITKKKKIIITASPWFSVSFNESLNHHQQNCQIDVNIRCWDGEKNVAQSVYYNLRFLQRPNVVNLKEEIMIAIKDLPMGKFLHLGMDGPSTNWNVLDLINHHQVANEFQETLNIGSCLLHILHSAFQTGMSKPGWDIGKILKVLYKIFDASSTCRDVYLCEGTFKV